MSMIHNERTKLLATALNNVGVATLITGVVAPTVATLYGATNVGGDRLWFGWNRPTLGGAVNYREAQAMTDIQVYMLIAPLVLLGIGAAAAYWWMHTPNH